MEANYDQYLGLNFSGISGKKYEITKYLNGGGNGFVFDCVDENGNTYVVKVLYNLEKKKIESFEKEIALLKSLNSKYIVKCIDSGKLKTPGQTKDRLFYIMKKYDCSLEELIRDNRITPTATFKYSIQICEALEKMHKRREPYIHRDLKPDNILYDKKKDSILVCDLGLTHIKNGNESKSEGFIGNIDYHAPEQKKRGSGSIGTYTDIYSLGLIINAMFTKKIVQGQGCKMIWECSPHFSFIDSIVERMTQNDIDKRECDISTVLSELQQHETECEFKESVLRKLYKKAGLPAEKAMELVDLFALSDRVLKSNDTDWSTFNLNYLCDYHFDCNEDMIDSLKLCAVFEIVRKKFEYEGQVYKGFLVPYQPISTLIEDGNKKYSDFVDFVESLNIYEELQNKKNIAKKYFLSLCDYHALEVISSIPKLVGHINDYYKDAPILLISYFVNNDFPEIKESSLKTSDFVTLVKYEESDVIDKKVLRIDKFKNYKKLIKKIKKQIPDASYRIENSKLKIFFNSINGEREFEKLMNYAINILPKFDVRRGDLFDILNRFGICTFKKIYTLDSADADTIEKYGFQNNT